MTVTVSSDCWIWRMRDDAGDPILTPSQRRLAVPAPVTPKTVQTYFSWQADADLHREIRAFAAQSRADRERGSDEIRTHASLRRPR